MAPPTRLRPHLDDLLQKNLELEHIVADLRHQLTQSSAKWADERKTLAVGCDVLMASFAKFRARLDVHHADIADSEGEVEQNLDASRQSEDMGEVDNLTLNGVLDTERDHRHPGSSMVADSENLHERCRVLAIELHAKTGELEESRRNQESAKVELQRIQRLLDTQTEQLETALAFTKVDTAKKVVPEGSPDDVSTHVSPSTNAGDVQEKLEIANQELSRLRQLLQEWKVYGGDWKQQCQIARTRAAELQQSVDELNVKLKAAEESKTQKDGEIKELTSSLANQTATAEQLRSTCWESEKRVQGLEATVSRLRTLLSSEQLAAFDSEQNQATTATPPAPPASASAPAPAPAPVTAATPTPASPPTAPPTAPPVSVTAPVPPAPSVPPTPPAAPMPPAPPGTTQPSPPRADTSTSKPYDQIMLKIPYRGGQLKFIKAPKESNKSRSERQSAPSQSTSEAVPVSPAPPGNTTPSTGINPTNFELCIHTCNSQPCRNDSRSFLWPRKQPSLPRHVLSTKRHIRCTDKCPGYRLLNMPLADAMKEPRRAKCRPPTEAELALAAEENKDVPTSEGPTQEGKVGRSASAGLGEPAEAEEGDRPWKVVFPEPSARRKRPRGRADGEESQRARKLRRRSKLP